MQTTTTKDLIAMLQNLDPSGNKPVVINHEGVGFDWLSGNLGNCAQGEINDGDECVIIPTST